MTRPQIVIENPILNAPFDAPARHFRFDDEGITDEIVDGRRPSSYFMPIPKAKKKGGQLVFDEWTGDRIEEDRLINQIRDRVGRWRSSGWQGVTPSSEATGGGGHARSRRVAVLNYFRYRCAHASHRAPVLGSAAPAEGGHRRPRGR